MISAGVAGAIDDGGVVLGGDDTAGLAEVFHRDGVELAADFLADDGAAGEDGDVAKHFLAAIAEARRLDREDLDRALELVHDQRRERFTVDVFGDDEQRAADLDDLLERREHVRDGRDLAVGDEDPRIVEDGLHAIRVGHEVGRDVASVELHALGVFLLEAQRLALFDGHDAVLADLVHDLGDDLADFRIRGGDRRDGGDLLARVDRAGLLLDLFDHGRDGLLDADADEHRVRARGDVADAFVDHRLAEDHGGGGSVAGHVVGLGRDFLEELGSHVLERVFELDVASDRHTIVGDRGGAELLVEDDVAPLRPDGHLDGFGQTVDALLERPTSGFVEYELLSQVCMSSKSNRRAEACAGMPRAWART